MNLDDREIEREFLERKAEFLHTLEQLERLKLLEVSNDQFTDLNRRLRLLAPSQRREFMLNIIARNVEIKLEINGFDKTERDDISRQLLINWNKIIDRATPVSLQELISNAISCWEKKQQKMKEGKQTVREKKFRYVGLARLLGAGTIFAFNTKGLQLNPGESVFLSSFWVGLTLFLDGNKDFYNTH